MNYYSILGLFIVFLCSFKSLEAAAPVTNEDIRNAILSVVHMIRSTEDKLERHEYRERTLGDQLKKIVLSIEKRQRLMDPVKGTLGRLDERLATVETILMQKDERERIQMQKTVDMIEQIHTSLPQLFETLKNDIITSFPKDEPKHEPTVSINSPSKVDLEKLQKEIETKIDSASNATFKNLENQLTKIREESQKNNKIQETASENFENVKQHINSSQQVLEKYENKLAEYNNRVDVLPNNIKAQNDNHVNLLQVLDVQKIQVEKLLLGLQNITQKLEKVPDVNNLEDVKNETLKSIEQLKDVVVQQATKDTAVITEKIDDLRNTADEKNEKLQGSVSEVRELSDNLNANIATSFEQLNQGIQDLTNLKKVMVQTSDSILDTKRRVEYGVHQILLEVGVLVNEHSKNVNSSIKERFDHFESSILDVETGALVNISNKISGEIDQVWRQIGIMHQQMSANSETLNKLESQTDEFVNGTLNTMDTMHGKVGKITSRMLEVDENLNYLLGRLSLVTQEFNQIKSGLGQALDDIKSSFKIVENKLNADHPGPHQIPSNEIPPDDKQV